MRSIETDEFICLDCEATGLDPSTDRVIEVAAVKFSFHKSIDQLSFLINPECPIPLLSQEIHNISDDMVKDSQTIDQVLPALLKFIDGHIIVGHGITFDLTILSNEAKRQKIPCRIHEAKFIDTLRLARLYGECPVNSLEMLRKHFNVPHEGAHRALNDVVVNIEVFKHLAKPFKTTKDLLDRMKKPVRLQRMPLGKHKGRKFDEIPIEYLVWASKKNFDQDLMYSIRSELKSRKKGNQFEQAANPFSSL